MDAVFATALRRGYTKKIYESVATDYLKSRIQRELEEVYELLGRILSTSIPMSSIVFCRTVE
jgi:hypothetical protein